MAKGIFLNHQFLIAMPAMRDPNFARSVTYVCQHNAEGAMGLVVNRRAPIKLADVLEQMQIETKIDAVAQAPVYLGGPVNPERGFVLHDDGGTWDSSMPLTDGLAITTSRDILVAISEGRGPRHSLIALGYSGWSEGQLEQELLANAWLTTGAQHHILFETELEQRWDAATRLIGIDPNQLSEYAGHA